jgi:mono/diheme cytochrome c family protein
MWGRIFRWGVFLALVGLGVYWFATRPQTVSEQALASLSSDPEAGRQVFYASGCASCHTAEKAEGDAKLVLAGGQSFPSPFGTFKAPNISTDATNGIGGWSRADFVTAVLKGVSPAGQHYFPAFPYTSYNKMTLQDAVDLHGFMQTLPADATPSEPHDVAFPFNIRRNLGGWKLLFQSEDWVADAPNAELERGRYLVEALGHCAECHTARNPLGGLATAQWMRGAPDPSGTGRVPGITPDLLQWSAIDIAGYLKTGFTPDFDTAGGHMVSVIENMGQLSDDDLNAIAAYLLALPN